MAITSAASVPTPEGVTLQDTIYGLRHQPVTFVANLVHKYGDIVRLPFGDRDLYLLNRPEFIQDIFMADTDTFAKRKDCEAEHAYVSQISGFLPLLDPTLIPRYAPVLVRAAEGAAERWRTSYAQSDHLEVDMYREMGRITLEVVIRTLFDADGEGDAEGLFNAILTMDTGYGFNPIETTLAGFLPPREITPPPKSVEARAFIRRYIAALADRDIQSAGTNSFFSRLVQHLGKEKAIDTGMTVMFAMHEVTDTTLPWCWYLLSQYPEVERVVSMELESVLGGRPPAYEDVAKLPQTSRMFEEVRRLYPSVWVIGRFVRRDHEFAGYTVPAGSVVLASQRVMHRDPRYFPDPEVFDPSRWTPEARRDRPTFSYFPFSAGPRACAGEAFAKTADPLIFGTLAQAWKARALPDQQLASIPQKSLAPRTGIRMKLEPQTTSR